MKSLGMILRTLLLSSLSGLGLLSLSCDAGSDFEKRMERARVMAEQGQFDELIPILTPMHYERPLDPELNHLYGLTLLNTNNAGMAVWPLRAAASSPGREVEDGLLLAQALSAGSVPMSAIDALDRVLEFYPDSSDAWQLRAKVNKGLRNFEDMLSDCEGLSKLFEYHYEGFFCSMDALIELGRFEEAEQLLADEREKIVPETRRRPLIEQRLCMFSAELAHEAEDLEEATARWESCLEVPRPSKQVLSAAVNFFEKEGNEERAIEILAAALENSEEDFELLSTLQTRLLRQERVEEAEALLLEATSWRRGSHRAWLVLAELYRGQEEFKKAVDAMENTLRQNSDAAVSTLGFAQYADDLIQIGQFDKADAVIEQLPEHPMVGFLRGRAYLVQGDAAAALAHFDEALVMWPGNLTARYLAGQAAERLGDVDRAIEEYRNAMRSGNAQTDAALDLARIFEAEWNLASAVKALQIHADARPDDVRVHLALLRIGFKSGRQDLVVPALEGISKIPGERVTHIVKSAEAEFHNNGPQAAADSILESDLDLESPEGAKALEALSEYWIQLGRGDEAVARVRKAVDQHPNEAALHEVHGSVLALSGSSPEVVQTAFERALELESDRSSSLAHLADHWVREGQKERAIALYDRVLELDGGDSESAWKAVELLANSSKDDAEIETRLLALLEQNPIHAKAASLRAAQLLERKKNLDLASELSQRAVRFGGGLDPAIIRARVALAQGDGTKGYDILKRVEAVGPQTPSTWYALGLAFEEAGDQDRARRALESALEYSDWEQADQVQRDLVRLPAGE